MLKTSKLLINTKQNMFYILHSYTAKFVHILHSLNKLHDIITRKVFSVVLRVPTYTELQKTAFLSSAAWLNQRLL